MLSTVKAFFSALWSWVSDFWGNVVDTLLWIPHKLFGELLDGFVAFLSAIPVPDFVSGIPGLFSAIPPGVIWFLSAFEFKFGITAVLAAYTLRFFFRALPWFF